MICYRRRGSTVGKMLFVVPLTPSRYSFLLAQSISINMQHRLWVADLYSWTNQLFWLLYPVVSLETAWPIMKLNQRISSLLSSCRWMSHTICINLWCCSCKVTLVWRSLVPDLWLSFFSHKVRDQNQVCALAHCDLLWSCDAASCENFVSK